MWKVSVILAEIQKHQPAIADVLQSMNQAWQAGEPWQEVVRHQFQAMPSISIDYAVLEPSDKVMMVPVSMGWSDVGSWDAVFTVAKNESIHISIGEKYRLANKGKIPLQMIEV